MSALLAIDAEYRRRAAAGELRRFAPRRHNPDHQPWLPVWHTSKDGWAFTAMYSNTRRAHALDKTRDWVIVAFHRERGPALATEPASDHATVVTEYQGDLRGKRVVRGRERECARHYGHDFVSREELQAWAHRIAH